MLLLSHHVDDSHKQQSISNKNASDRSHDISAPLRRPCPCPYTLVMSFWPVFDTGFLALSRMYTHAHNIFSSYYIFFLFFIIIIFFFPFIIILYGRVSRPRVVLVHMLSSLYSFWVRCNNKFWELCFDFSEFLVRFVEINDIWLWCAFFFFPPSFSFSFLLLLLLFSFFCLLICEIMAGTAPGQTEPSVCICFVLHSVHSRAACGRQRLSRFNFFSSSMH